MAAKKICRTCGEHHAPFQRCPTRENQREGVSYWKKSLPDGYRLWNRDQMEGFERHGNMIVQKSGMKLRPHSGSITEKENP